MKRFLIVAALALLLPACAQVQKAESFLSAVSSATVTQDDVDEARLSYDAVMLSAGARYRKLPLCLKGQTFLKDHCRTHSLTVKLQTLDKKVERSFDAVQGALDRGDKSALSIAYNGLMAAIDEAKTAVVSNGI